MIECNVYAIFSVSLSRPYFSSYIEMKKTVANKCYKEGIE